MVRRIATILAVALCAGAAGRQGLPGSVTGAGLPYPVLFVTQVPVRPDFTTITSTFGNHLAAPAAAGRGGDLWIRYSDGTLKNLTLAAGFGGTGLLTGSKAIAVRDPAMHWSGTKALISMVVGAPTQQFELGDYFWQLYEVTGFLTAQDRVTITPVPHQPQPFNNVAGIYGTDDRIIFTSDRPRNGAPGLYPQLDEYEEASSTSGLWSLDPATGDLRLLNHAPSGDFSPIIDSFGRVVFTQWDHLQRDQQADADAEQAAPGTTDCRAAEFGTFNYASEGGAEFNLDDRAEVFPEPRPCRTDLLPKGDVGQEFNHFLPWQILEDGREGETLNHLGRHDLGFYIAPAVSDDPNIVEFARQYGGRDQRPAIRTGLFQLKESPTQPGTFFAVDAPEFATHASGQIVSFDAPIDAHADDIVIRAVTARETYETSAGPQASGRYREPVPLSDGRLIAVHTTQAGSEAVSGNLVASIYDFRLTTMAGSVDGSWIAGEPLTSGIRKSISFWDPDELVSFDGILWELNPVEVRPRQRPPRLTATLDPGERQMFSLAEVDISSFQAWLAQSDLALAIVRNATSRDRLDRQQPFNLRVPGGTQTIGAPGRVYDVTQLQFFGGEQLRGVAGCCGEPRPGRRVTARPLDSRTTLGEGFSGVVPLAADGSAAALVPARRALSWQLTDGAFPIVRERLWLTFQPGEIRTCPSCHGISTADQAAGPPPSNPPEALLSLLRAWKRRGQ